MKGFLIKTLAFLPLSLLLFLGDARQVFAQDIFWSTPQKIAPANISTDFALRPDIATDSKGYVYAVWQQNAAHPINTNPPRTPAGIWYSSWNGDSWSTPQQLNIPIQGFPTKPSIDITPNDDIHVVWAEDTAEYESWDQIWYTRYSAGSWSQPITISAHQVNYSWEWQPVITSDTAGNLYVIYNYSNMDLFGSYLYYTKYTQSTSSWSTPANISQGLTFARDSDLVIDSSGNVHVLIWNDSDGAPGGVFYTYYNGSTWSSLGQLRTGEAVFPRLVIDGANNLHATWATIVFATPGPGWETHLEYAQKPAAGSWSSPYMVSTTVSQPWWWIPLSGLTVDSSNNAYVGWGQYNSTWYNDTFGPNNGSYGIDAMYRRRNTDGTWTAPNLIRSTKYLDAPTIWRDKWWNQHFVWSEMDPTTNQWQFWYSEVPANVGSYSPSSALTITMAVTNDTIKIPASALATTATISAQVGPVPASRDPLVTTIPRSYTFRPQGTTFIVPKVATATIRYTDAEVLGSNESQLKAYIWDATLNSGAGGWSSSYTTSVNTNTNRLSIDLAHFSLYGIMGPKAQNNVNVNWLPPISNSELYSMTDGSTLPIKFTLSYEDGVTAAAPTSPEDLVLYIRQIVNGEIQGAGVLEYNFGTANNNVRYDPGNGQYLLTLKTKELNLAPGLYNVKVIYQGFTWGSHDFQITEPGKVKGAVAP